MGDKGGKKDKDKSQKQKAAKQDEQAQKKQDKLDEWVNKNVGNAYIMIIDDYKNCDFYFDWFDVDN